MKDADGRHGVPRGTHGTEGMTGLTKMQLDYCNNLIKGDNKVQAARKAYPNSGKGSIKNLAWRNWRNKNCQRYLEDQLMTSDVASKATKELFRLIHATKVVSIDGENEEVPDNMARLKSIEMYLKLVQTIAKDVPADPEGAFEDTFWIDWYKQENGREPSAEELAEFKGRNVEVSSNEVQERLFGSTALPPVKVSFNPKTFVD